MILLSFCSFPWWLSWLLPFLLGLLLGWTLWSKYKKICADLEGQVSSLNGKITGLEGELKADRHSIAELEGDVSLAKGRLRETEEELARCRKENKAGGKKGSGKGSDSNKGGNNSSNSDDGTSGIASNVMSAAAGAAGSAISGVSSLTDSGSSDGGSSDSGGETNDGGNSNSGASGDGGGSHLAALGNDNLQIIEGIGPKMEEVLKANGINNWSDLASKSADDLRGILNNYGDKYKIIDVTTWQQQAQYASKGDQAGLIEMQKNIAGGNDNTLTTSDSKLEKFLIRKGILKRWKKDDLKAIEGIGPKIAGLLKDGGIDTWKALAEADVADIKKILDDAGPRYKLADPGTWPRQSGMADAGEWDELKAYQDKLTRGK